MNTAVENIVKPIIDKSIMTVSNTVSGTRNAAVASANFIARGKKPVKILTASGLKLNTITHQSIARFISTQSDMVEGTLLATADRLETAANAHSVRELVQGQVAMLPATRDRLSKDARKTFELLVEARDDLGELVSDTVVKLRKSGDDVTTKAKRTVSKARKTAKKAPAKARAAATKKARATRKKVSKVRRKASRKVS